VATGGWEHRFRPDFLKGAPMVVVKPAIATAGSRRRDARAFGQRLEGNGGGHQRKDAARSYGVDDVRLDFDVPTGAAALAGVSAAVRCVKRKAPPPHTPSIGRPADHNSERPLQNRNLRRQSSADTEGNSRAAVGVRLAAA